MLTSFFLPPAQPELTLKHCLVSSLILLCLSSLGFGQSWTYNEARALLETERNTVQIAARYSGSVVSVNVRAGNVLASSAPYRFTHKGSGFVVELSGAPYIITNHHVIDSALLSSGRVHSDAKLEVTFFNGPFPQRVPVQLTYADAARDVALLEPLDEAFPNVEPLYLGDSSQLQVGQKVIAIGSPFGLDTSVTEGIVSALNRRLPGESQAMVQTDAAINPGSSGGPLLNAAGELIGISTAIYNPSGGVFVGVGLAVPSRHLLETVRAAGFSPTLASAPPLSAPLPPAALGAALVEVDDLPRSVRVLYGVPERGLLVVSVAAGGSARAAGLRASREVITYGDAELLLGGDVIVAVDGFHVTSTDHLLELMRDAQGVRQVTVVRAGEELVLSLPPLKEAAQ